METTNLKSSENEQQKSSEIIEKKPLSAADLILQKYKKRQQESNKDDSSEKEKTSEKQVVVEKEVSSEKTELEELKDLSKELKEIVKKEEEKVVVEQKKVEKTEKEEVVESKEEVKTEVEKVSVDYNELDKNELILKLEELLKKPVMTIKDEVEIIKSVFYKKHKAETLKNKQKFIEANPDEEFKPEQSEDEKKFKETYKKYQELKAEHNRKKEEEKQANFQEKLSIITQIENLVNTQETMNKTFDDFKELQQKWKEVGLVPQEETKDLWSKYNFANEKFYDFVKINQELRDLDLRKNLEIKIELCERAEKLMLAEKIIKAFQDLQLLHIKWKETGPAPREKRDEIWERFKEATAQINKRHHEFFQELKVEQENNLKAKTLICDKVEEISNLEIVSHKEWKDTTNEVVELQKIWKLIGFAPRKENNEIYHRFRNLCDSFFNKKREFYGSYNEELENNLQKKTDLCVQVENIKDSTDWRKSTIAIVDIQKQWKTIGHVPKKDFETLRKRFGDSCNFFFDKKKEFFAGRIKQEEDNLKLKEELILKIKEIDTSKDGSFNELQAFQKEWTTIGFVPFKNKDEVYKSYQTVVDEKFSHFKINSKKRNAMQFESRLDNMTKAPNAKTKINLEIEKLKTNLATINDEIILWENNMGFFAKSKNAESMINDFNKKIEKSKKEAEDIKKNIISLEVASKKI